jgi:hypothetical protein
MARSDGGTGGSPSTYSAGAITPPTSDVTYQKRSPVTVDCSVQVHTSLALQGNCKEPGPYIKYTQYCTGRTAARGARRSFLTPFFLSLPPRARVVRLTALIDRG